MFLMHVLPKGFVRIRHYGLLSCRNKAEKMTLCRNLLGCEQYISRLRDAGQYKLRVITDSEEPVGLPIAALIPEIGLLMSPAAPTRRSFGFALKVTLGQLQSKTEPL